MAVLHILAKTEKVDKAGAIYWELETNTGKHRAWERNNKEGLEVGSWYECEITQQGNFLPQLQKSILIDAPPSRPDGLDGVQDIPVATQPAVPQEVWEANHRGEDMRSAIHAVASICQAVAQGLVIPEFSGTTPEGRSLEVFPLIDRFYAHIQEARKDSYVIAHMPLQPIETSIADLAHHGLGVPVRTPVPALDIPALRKALGWSGEDYLKYLHDTYNYKEDGPGLTLEQMAQIKADLQAKVQASGS